MAGVRLNPTSGIPTNFLPPVFSLVLDTFGHLPSLLPLVLTVSGDVEEVWRRWGSIRDVFVMCTITARGQGEEEEEEEEQGCGAGD